MQALLNGLAKHHTCHTPTSQHLSLPSSPSTSFADAAADEPALAASTSPTAAADTADNTAALEAELAMPRAAATTTSSSSHYEAARPTTPGGSSITDAIRAEISRGSTPRHSMSFEPAAAAATSPAYAPAAFNAPHTGTAHMAGGASPLAGGGTGEEEEFVDARSVSTESSLFIVFLYVTMTCVLMFGW